VRLVALASVVGAVVLLAACGGSATQADPFVGTWRSTDPMDSPRSGFVIAKTSAGYQVAWILDGSLYSKATFYRHGDRLQDFPPDAAKPEDVIPMFLAYKGEPGRLRVRYGNGLPYTVHRESDSTQVPSP
jgi:hypothetical protein